MINCDLREIICLERDTVNQVEGPVGKWGNPFVTHPPKASFPHLPEAHTSRGGIDPMGKLGKGWEPSVHKKEG